MGYSWYVLFGLVICDCPQSCPSCSIPKFGQTFSLENSIHKMKIITKSNFQCRCTCYSGNHRDAWTYGAIDPGSGTAAVIETARALGHFLNKV